MRCFFHIIHVGGQVDDDEGSLLDSLEQAKDVAQTTLQELVVQAVTRGHPWTVTGIRICSDVSELAVILMDPVVEKVLRNSSDK
jgi:hypothetical protein